MYVPSKALMSFHIAGFEHADGITVARAMEVGDELTLRIEPDNPYDRQAVALFYHGVKIGYIPADRNAPISQLLALGHGDILQARVAQKDLTQHPERQFRATIFIKDGNAAQGAQDSAEHAD